MKLLSFLAAALLAVAPAGAQPAPTPPSDALVEDFISVLPDAAGLGVVDEPDPEELGRLNRLNPGKEAQVRPILEAFQTCIAPAMSDGIRRMIGNAARSLGEAKLERLVAFYRSEDLDAVKALATRVDGPSPSAADTAEAARLMAAYPVAEFRAAYARELAGAEQDEIFMAAATQCYAEQYAALDAAGLRNE